MNINYTRLKKKVVRLKPDQPDRWRRPCNHNVYELQLNTTMQYHFRPNMECAQKSLSV